MNWTTTKKRQLLRSLTLLRSENEVGNFYRDLMTDKEIEEFANRFRAAQMLETGASYVQIEKKLGLSSTTIARVAKALNGKAGGYKLVIERLHHQRSS